VELFPLPEGGYVADTPGFSALEIEQFEKMTADQLQYCFPEFEPYIEDCRFTGCSHTKEKGCAVLAALQAGEIAPSRHQSYLALYEKLKDIRQWQLDKQSP
jgi:ribosome biogenesis GTPase